MTEEIKTEIPTDCSYYKDVIKNEILIDGVDVAGCIRLQDDKISCDLGGECKGWENCYYKQLKSLEQENKEEKKAYNECMHYLACMTEQRNKLKIVLEEILEIVRTDCKGCTAECDCDEDCTRYMIKNKINEGLGDN